MFYPKALKLFGLYCIGTFSPLTSEKVPVNRYLIDSSSLQNLLSVEYSLDFAESHCSKNTLLLVSNSRSNAVTDRGC